MNLILLWLKVHALVVLLIVATIFSTLWLYRMREHLRLKLYIIPIITILHTVIGVLSVKAFAFLESGDFSNMSLFGGVFFMPLIYLIGAKLTKRPVATVCDVFTPCMLFTLMCARINCIISGCCTGLLIPGTHLHFPTRALEILYYILMLALLLPRIQKNKTLGTAYPFYMLTYGLVRFCIEFMRTSTSPKLFHIGHLWAVVCFMIGFSIYATLMEKIKKQRRKNKG